MSEHTVYAAPIPHIRLRAHQSSPQTDRQATAGVAVVYYLRMSDGCIKIGTSRRALERIAAHRRNAGAEEVLAVEFGSYDLERERHLQFASDLVRGREIFHPSDALMAHIAELRNALNLTP